MADDRINTFAKRGKKITGQRFGKLVAVHPFGLSGESRFKGYNWVCYCDCGGLKITKSSYLIRGDVKSCGCLSQGKGGGGIFIRKGLDDVEAKLYRVWSGIKKRCLQKSHASYKYYGAKGVTICERWMKFDHFLVDMRAGFRFGLTVDRIDGSKGYSPENCRWATMKEQSNNKFLG